MSFMSAYNQARVRSLEDTIDDWEAHCNQLKAEIRKLDNDADIWAIHYSGLAAERDYLLALLDEKCGGADKNPARQVADVRYRIPNGERKGQALQVRDVVNIRKIDARLKSHKKQWADWFSFIRDYGIFK